MDLRADAPVFVPAQETALIGDLLIQKLATEIEQTAPAEANRASQSSAKKVAKHVAPKSGEHPTPSPPAKLAAPRPQLKNIGNLPASGIFCPWCQMRTACAFHSSTGHESASSKPAKAMTPGILHDSSQPLPVPHARSATTQPKVSAHTTTGTCGMAQSKPRASEWLDIAAASKKATDDEDASTDGGSSSPFNAESDGSDVSSMSTNSLSRPQSQELHQKGYITMPCGSTSETSPHGAGEHSVRDTRTLVSQLQ